MCGMSLLPYVGEDMFSFVENSILIAGKAQQWKPHVMKARADKLKDVPLNVVDYIGR
jgi:hypothetical protein